MELPGLVDVVEVATIDADGALTRATGRTADGRPVGLITHTADLPSADDRARLTRHHRRLASIDHPCIPAVEPLVDLPTRVAIVFAMPTGPTMATWAADRRRTRTEVVEAIASLGEAFVLCHRRGVAGGALDPQRVIMNAATPVAVELAFETRLDDPLSDQPALARLAVGLLAARDADDQWPASLTAVLARAAAVRPDDRYASMVGLVADLRRGCRFSWPATDDASWVGSNRSLESWNASPTFTEREGALSLLDDVADVVEREHRPLVVVVSGPSGVGRTALLQHWAGQRRGRGDIVGRSAFSPAGDDPPFAAPRAAFAEACAVLAAGPGSASVGHLITTTLGDDASTAKRLLPGLDLLMSAGGGDSRDGRGPSVDEHGDPAGGIEPRFSAVDIGALTRRALEGVASERPLIMVLDDADASDAASIDLLGLMCVSGFRASIMVVVSVRAGKLRPALRRAFDSLASVGRLREIELDPLSEHGVAERLSHGTGQTIAELQPLAAAIAQHSGGIPRRIESTIATLLDSGDLHFDERRCEWAWTATTLSGMPPVNADEAASDTLAELAPPFRHMLLAVAVAGRLASAQVLAAATEQTDVSVSDDIAAMVLAGHLTPERQLPGPSREASLRFTDVRLRDAVLASDYHAVARLSGRIARAAIEQSPRGRGGIPEPSDDHLFEILGLVDEQSFGDVLTSEHYVALCERAARVAHQRGAFDLALEIQLRAISASGPMREGVDRDATFELYIRAAQHALAVNRPDLADQLVDSACSLRPSAVVKVRAMAILGTRWWSRQEAAAGLAETRLLLDELGYPLPRRARPRHVLWALVKARWAIRGKEPEWFADAPEATDPQDRAALDAMTGAVHLAYTTEPLTHAVMVLNGLRISARKGVSRGSAYFVTAYGLLLCATGRFIPRGLRFGSTGMGMAERTEGDTLSMVRFAYEGFVRHWGHPLADTIAPLQQEYADGRRAGRGGFSFTAATFAVLHRLLSEQLLLPGADVADELIGEFDGLDERAFSLRVRVARQAIDALVAGDSRPAGSNAAYLEGEWFSIAQWRTGRRASGEFALMTYTLEAFVALAVGDDDRARWASGRAAEYLRAAPGTAAIAIHRFQRALLAADAYAAGSRRSGYRRARRRFDRLARHADHDGQPRRALIDAVHAQRRHPNRADAAFDVAAHAALDAGAPYLLALGRERRARWLERRGDIDAAIDARHGSVAALNTWGAHAAANGWLARIARGSADGAVPNDLSVSPEPTMTADASVPTTHVSTADQPADDETFEIVRVEIADMDALRDSFGAGTALSTHEEIRRRCMAWLRGRSGDERRCMVLSSTMGQLVVAYPPATMHPLQLDDIAGAVPRRDGASIEVRLVVHLPTVTTWSALMAGLNDRT